ncbi:MAG: endonuclease MutS2 [Clostridiales bacterium]|nr:endonuclease MutS2 [Clostridiales bacterium]
MLKFIPPAGGGMEINVKQPAFKTLEFDKILEKMASFTDSETVRDRIISLEPFDDIEKARMAQKETTEAVITVLRIGNPPFGLGVSDITACVKRTEIGGFLNPHDLINISRLLYVSRRMKMYLEDAPEKTEILHGLGNGIITCKPLEYKINAAILSETEIADDASADLAAIRRKMRSLNAKIKDSLNTMIHSETYKKYLQDPIVTIRSDRYVIPVKAEYRGEIAGIVHDSSASGATLFVEPMSVVNANNEIRNLIGMEQLEIERILSQLSAETAENSGVILTDYEIVCNLDFIFCKAKLSFDMKATEPILNDQGIIEFKKARHPLIDKDKVVANDIYLGEKFNTLVITGPNTGGKTVTLKTIGLCSVMAAAGLHIPVNDNSRAAVFKHFFADIGDEQSIEQSLSTFSSHMVKIVDIVNKVDSDSLALFDELGAGTDPTEGAALAISILETLRGFGAATAATTHYSELKIFALTTDGVENASCEFDVDSLQPTYKLLIGVPGKSNAFAISRRLGLPEAIIARANEILSDEDIKFEDVITDLEQNRAEAESEREYAKRVKNEITELKAETERERRKVKESKSRILEDARREAKLIVLEAREEANSIIKELERMKIEGKTANAADKIQKSREKLKSREEKLDKAMKNSAKPKPFRKPPKNLKEGDSVRLIDMNQLATVLKKPDAKGMVRVQAGIVKMDVHVSGLELVKDNSAKELTERYVKSTNAYASKTKNVSTEIDVRGQTLDEAIMNVEKFIDDCYLAGISPVTVIHGKGTGILRSGIGDMLRRNKHVKSQRMGRYGEGEMGVTIVEIENS